jgi:uncharacterized protein YggE
MPLKSLLLAIVVAAIAAIAAPAWAQDERTPFQATTLHLSATGEAHVAPDIATITLGVQTDAPSAAEALRQNRVQMTATLAALKAQGVREKDIQTSGLSLNPQYVFHDGEPRRLTGYQAMNNVTITVRDLSRLGAAVDAVVAAGANEVNGVAFSLADPQAGEDQARRAAVKALQAKAALYAEASGYRLDRLVSLSDTAPSSVRTGEIMVTSMRYKAAPTPVSPGELDVTATVSAVYELRK